MQTIYKYEIGPDQTCVMPVNATLLGVEMQGVNRDRLCLWAIVDTDNVSTTYTFKVYATGQAVNYRTEDMKYIGTVHDVERMGLVFHVFQLML